MSFLSVAHAYGTQNCGSGQKQSATFKLNETWEKVAFDFDSESNGCDLKHSFESVGLGPSPKEQRCCLVLFCRRWAICPISWAWDWKSQASRNVYSISSSSYDSDPSHLTSPSPHSLKWRCYYFPLWRFEGLRIKACISENLCRVKIMNNSTGQRVSYNYREVHSAMLCKWLNAAIGS